MVINTNECHTYRKSDTISLEMLWSILNQPSIGNGSESECIWVSRMMLFLSEFTHYNLLGIFSYSFQINGRGFYLRIIRFLFFFCTHSKDYELSISPVFIELRNSGPLMEESRSCKETELTTSARTGDLQGPEIWAAFSIAQSGMYKNTLEAWAVQLLIYYIGHLWRNTWCGK